MLALQLLGLASLIHASVNLEFQVDGNTSNSAVQVDVKYQPANIINIPAPTPTRISPGTPSPVQSSTGATNLSHSADGPSTPGRATHSVRVGVNNELIFSPSQVVAAVGDVIVFTFENGNHTLTQSTLTEPCTNTGQFDSGFAFGPDSTVKNLSILVQNSNPMWFFCRQHIPKSHCSAGMVFALNPGTYLEEFLANTRGVGKGAALNVEQNSATTFIRSSTSHPSTSKLPLSRTSDASATDTFTVSSRQTTLAVQVVASNATIRLSTPPIPSVIPLVSRSTRESPRPGGDTRKSHKLSWLAAAVVVTVLVRRVVREGR